MATVRRRHSSNAVTEGWSQLRPTPPSTARGASLDDITNGTKGGGDVFSKQMSREVAEKSIESDSSHDRIPTQRVRLAPGGEV